MPYDPRTGKYIPDTMGAMGAGPGGGQFTPEQAAYMMENMPAITQQESEMERAVALSEQLRQGQNPQARKRMDAASQASRALEGFGSGMQDYKIAKGIGDLDAQKKKYYGGLADLMRPKPAAAAPVLDNRSAYDEQRGIHDFY